MAKTINQYMKHYLLILLGGISSMFSFAQINLTSGLTGYFPLDGNANDLSTTAINGTNNGASATSGYTGLPATAMNFVAAQSDYIDAGNNNRGITNQMSISLWFKISGNGTYNIAEKYNWMLDAGFYIRMVNGQLYFHGRDQSGVGHAPPPTSSTYNDGEWHHLVAIVNLTHWMLYVDCEQVQDYVTSSSSPDITVNAPLTFGRYTVDNNAYLDGDLDEIRLYNRVLTNDEICYLCGSSYDFTNGLTGHFPLNGNANDISTTALNGTNNGASSTTGFDATPGGAMSFVSAQSDYIDAGNNNRGITDQMSISVWFRISGNGTYNIAEKYNWTMDAGFYIRMVNGQLYFHGRDQSGVGHAPPPTSTTYNDGQWHNLIAIVDVNHWMLYVDCDQVQDYVTATSSPDITVNYPLTFGRYTLDNNGYLDGDLDEIRLYSRPLSNTEICHLCHNTVVIGIDETNTGSPFVIYPNPSTDIISIKGLEKLTQGYAINMHNILGQKVATVTNQSTVDVSGFANGIYVLNIVDLSNGKLVHSAKIIKQ